MFGKKKEDENKVPAIFETTMNNEFAKKATPVKLADTDELFLFKCPNCGGLHFRHAGYLEMMMPYMRADQSKHVNTDSYSVKVCVACRNAYIWVNDQVYDVTDHINMEAWEEFERVAHKCTGPGGQC